MAAEAARIIRQTRLRSNGTGHVLGGGKFANGAQTAAYSNLFNHWAHWLELLVYGSDAHKTLQERMAEKGYVVERPSVGDWKVDGRFDIASRDGSLWEIKRFSNAGMAAGELALEAYTDNTGFRRGEDLLGLKVGEMISLRGEHNWYTYKNLGSG